MEPAVSELIKALYHRERYLRSNESPEETSASELRRILEDGVRKAEQFFLHKAVDDAIEHVIRTLGDLESAEVAGNYRPPVRETRFSKLINDAWGYHRPALGEAIDSTIRIDFDPCVFVDPQRFFSLLENLIANAITTTRDAIQSGVICHGTILVDLSLEEYADGDWLALRISDQGMGFTQYNLERTLNGEMRRPNRKGLGWQIIRDIVHFYVGKIIVESAICCGTRVTVLIDLNKIIVVPE